jgi:hypothetical protein
MAKNALRGDQDDATIAVLTVVASHTTLNWAQAFDQSPYNATRGYWPALIDEARVSASPDRF